MKAKYDELFFSRTGDFLDVYLTKQIGKSPETVKSYRFALLAFYNFIVFHKKINPLKFRFTDCTHSLGLEYSEYLRENCKYKPATINHRIAALKSYSRYVSDDDISLVQMRIAIESIPMQKVPLLQRPVIPREAVAELLDIPETSKFSIRDRNILILLFDTAIRLSELTNIKIGDLHLETDNPYLYAHGKGNKEREVSLSINTRDHLRHYIFRFHVDGNNPEAPLFYTIIKGNMSPMSGRNVERIVDKYATLLKRDSNSEVPKKIHPHMFRRTRATGWYQDGVPLEMVSRMLGHRYTDTTKIYASPSVEQMRSVIEKNSNEEPEEPLWIGEEDNIAKKFHLK